jgi:CysZ protein
MRAKNSQPLAHSGACYLIKGFELIRLKGIRRFVFVPLTINLLLFGSAFYYLFSQVSSYMQAFEQQIPAWLNWLSYLLWPLALFSLLVVFSFVFSAFANFIAAPFNGLLSEKMETLLTGQQLPDDGFGDIIKDIPRTFGREWTKLRYYLPRAIGFFILLWFLPIIGQIIWFLFVAWMMAIQYLDYPFDNHKVSFREMKYALQQKKGLSYGFGITAALFAMLPVINLVVMPVAICGATALWVDHHREDYAARSQ